MRDFEKRKFQAKVVIWSIILCAIITVVSTYHAYVKREAQKELYNQIKAQVVRDIRWEIENKQKQYMGFINYSGFHE